MCAALSSTLLFGGEENRSESLLGYFLDSLKTKGFFLFICFLLLFYFLKLLPLHTRINDFYSCASVCTTVMDMMLPDFNSYLISLWDISNNEFGRLCMKSEK